MKVTPLSLKKKFALELWRKHEQNMLQEHPLQQLFGSVRSVATFIVAIVEVTVLRNPNRLICLWGIS